MELQGATQAADIRTYLRMLNRRKVTVGLTTLTVVALALAYSFVKSPLYTARAQLLVPEKSVTSALAPAASQSDLPATESLQRMLLDAQQFAQGDQTRKAAAAILGHAAPIAVSASSTTDVLTFTSTNSSNTEAAAIANAYAQAYVSASRANEVAQYTQQVAALQSSIAQLQRSAAASPPGSLQQAAVQSTINSFTQSLQQLQAASQLAAQTGPSVITAAKPPKSPSSPKPVRNGLLGLLVGLVLGVGLALLRDRLDDKVKSLADIEANSDGHPVIGTIPVVDSWRRPSQMHLALKEDPSSTVSEAYRTLRTAIQFLRLDGRQRVVGITSSTPGEGKSTTTANLALSFARAGQRVVVMSCDFRRPRMHEFFGLDNRVGVTSVLLGQNSLQEAASAVPGEPHLRVIPSGPVPPNPAEILSLGLIGQLVELLAASADLVLIDCPPVLPVTDSMLISRVCDSMLVVTAATTTKKSHLRRTYDLLSQVQAPLGGTIVNSVPNRAAYASEYSNYQYEHGDSYTSRGGYLPGTNDHSALSSDHWATGANGQRYQAQVDPALEGRLTRTNASQPAAYTEAVARFGPADLFAEVGSPPDHGEHVPAAGADEYGVRLRGRTPYP